MKIAFIPSGMAPFQATTIAERPLGGIETAVVRLAEALSEIGNHVTVFSRYDNPLLTKPLYLPLRALADLGEIDILIVVRELLPLFSGIKTKLKFYWTGDSYDHLQHLGLGDKRTIANLSAFLAVSQWQARAICEVSGFPHQRSRVLPNGIDLRLFEGSETRNQKRLIYSSSPWRGLHHLVRLFPRIKAEVAEAELHVFSGFDVYEGSGMDIATLEKQHRPIFDALQKIEGCYLHGNVKQEQLAREFMRSAVLAYPNIFEETSCITVLEAQAAGCVPVTSARAALPETVAGAGITISGEPGQKDYDQTFVSSITKLLSDPAHWAEYSKKAIANGARHSWHRIAKEFSDWTGEILCRK